MKKAFGRRDWILLVWMIATPVIGYGQIPPFSAAGKPWNSDELGNIRAVVRVSDASRPAFAHIEWRRRDHDPAAKNVIVTAADGTRVMNVTRGRIEQEFGEVEFQPIRGDGVYYVYYLPYKKAGSANYPRDFYPKFEETASAEWLSQAAAVTGPNAEVVGIESVDAFNTFFPMEIIASRGETERIIAQNKDKAFVVFPEDRMFPIKMFNYLPERWIEKGVRDSFSGAARRGEYYAFQFGVFALKDISNLKVSFTALKGTRAGSIPSGKFNCINTGGVDYESKGFVTRVDVAGRKVQPIWCGLDVPLDAAPGVYSGTATISSSGELPQKIDLKFQILNEAAPNNGFDEPEKLTRLKWLDSTLAQGNAVISPYTPLQVRGSQISLLGRRVTIGDGGLPRAIETFFTPEMTSIGKTPKRVLDAPIRFVVEDGNGKSLEGKWGKPYFGAKTDGAVVWNSPSQFPGLSVNVSGSLEFDGFAAYTIKLTADRDISLNDIRLEIPLNADAARYMMGLGEKGRKTPDELKWKWDVATKNQDGAWLGNVNAGLQFSLRDEKYVRPLNTNFYLQKPLLLPSSWGNEGKGGINISTTGSSVLVTNYSGRRTMKKGESLYYNFNLLITPFHAIDTDWQWSNRFYHKYAPIDEIKKTGATVINIHHATKINPYINYPFIAHREMKEYIDEAHSKGLKVKIYNTVRELSNHAYELPALRSLGHEIYSPGKGGGFSWLQEHVGDDYIAAWFVPELKDAAIVNSGMSRWHNYYVEGMNWLVRNVGIDGIYLDDVAFDRVTMKRIKRVLAANGHPGIIDLHSANQFNKNDGFNNSAMLYMEHFPYLNRLWFGEYFDYENNSPDFFLTEVSGIPFGLMGEMLEKGGNPWRGMIYGMTNRMPWSDNADPRPIWKVWDDFGMKGTQMLGYWAPSCPVRTSEPNVLATVYKKKGAALISIASWAASDTKIRLNIDWAALGLDPEKATITAPEVSSFQHAAVYRPGDLIPVERNKGLLLVVK
jgi:hypothetical protein